MTAIKAYLLRLILCGFLVSLTGALLRGKKAGRLLSLCGGCLLLLTALRPLLRVDLTRLPDLVTGLDAAERAEAAREKNDKLLRELVERQSAAWIEDRAEKLGMELTAEVSARAEAESVFVPDAVTLRGRWTETQRSALAAVLETELGVPPARQRWEGG